MLAIGKQVWVVHCVDSFRHATEWHGGFMQGSCVYREAVNLLVFVSCRKVRLRRRNAVFSRCDLQVALEMALDF